MTEEFDLLEDDESGVEDMVQVLRSREENNPPLAHDHYEFDTRAPLDCIKGLCDEI